ncbi:methyltransferase domain-containing protein [Amycolatopsis suaedae]|uniref:Class I SAM-dependent methyltransferase n=1 Tax=Amycolatopsis suaedae TaxID=2510978 RepID=A0A4Q7J1E4_9PSEU|nr:class I SAM-dependent methyltransferase [Amycolatopsis suaedae]RZQ61221.1 class I SAM-dependent methyltransferase [Amycolatopsis suaedae]
MSGFSPDWLALREPADAAARADDLAGLLRDNVGEPDRAVIRDLGCGTGSMGRWLRERWPGARHWILQDRDPGLLALAGASMTGQGVTVETRLGDLTGLRPADLEGTSAVTASALLDLLTTSEVEALAATCVAAGVPALFTLSVTGRVDLDPADPLDAEFEAAFNAHQRRETGGRHLLGPDAVEAATVAFRRRGAEVVTRPSPWRLGPDQAALTAEWLRGWVGAACEQEPALAEAGERYLRGRLAAGVRVTVGHADLLALPGAAA